MAYSGWRLRTRGRRRAQGARPITIRVQSTRSMPRTHERNLEAFHENKRGPESSIGQTPKVHRAPARSVAL